MRKLNTCYLNYILVYIDFDFLASFFLLQVYFLLRIKLLVMNKTIKNCLLLLGTHNLILIFLVIYF